MEQALPLSSLHRGFANLGTLCEATSGSGRSKHLRVQKPAEEFHPKMRILYFENFVLKGGAFAH